jgi:catechol 2,3-dioxygenase-like lactoylglutathione lyase family enzyme
MLALRDPDGHRIRILESGSDEGDPRWDRASAVFLGIDHVALPVGTSGRSLAFYRDTLGLTVVEPREIRDRLAGDSLSKASASSRTTTLRAAAGPAIHLQEPFASANDPVSGRTGVGHHRWWPAEAFATGAPDSRFTRVLSDPDGHLVLLRPR